MPLIKRLIKDAPLTFAEGDANLVYLEELATNTGSFAVTTTNNLFNGNQTVLGYVSASSFTGSLFAQDLTVTGTINAQQLIVQTELQVTNTGVKIGNMLTDTHSVTGSVNITGSLNVTTAGIELQVTNTGVRIGNMLTDTHSVTGSVSITGSLSSIGTLSITNDVSASNLTRLTFGPGTPGGSNLFLQSSGSTTSNALEIRPYGLNNNTNSYLFVQPQNVNFGRSITFDQNNASITIINGNSDGGFELRRPGQNTGEARLASNNPFGGGGFITFYTSGTEKARIFSNGNVAIGTTTDAGFTLDVTGTGRFTGALTLSSIISSASTFTIQNTLGAGDMNFLVGGSTFFAIRNTGTIISGGSLSNTTAVTGGSNGTSRMISNNTFTGTQTAGTLNIYSANPNVTSFTHTSPALLVGYSFVLTSAPSGGGSTYAFRSTLNTGNNAWNLYMSGTAPNYLAGNLLVGTTTDIASSKLTIESTTQGFLPPRMTTSEKNAISSPATGLVVFDTTLGKLCVFATTWQTISST